jgi:hypothetical protein
LFDAACYSYVERMGAAGDDVSVIAAIAHVGSVTGALR